MSLSKLDSVWVFFKNFSFLKQTFIINYSFFFNPPQRAFFSLLLERKEGVGRERGGQRERKRERERDWLVASHIYPVVWDGTHSLGMCPDQESNGTATFRFTGRRSSRATPPARAGSQYLEPPSGEWCGDTGHYTKLWKVSNVLCSGRVKSTQCTSDFKVDYNLGKSISEKLEEK